MKRTIVALVIIALSCNMSDSKNVLPSGYNFVDEGGYNNIVVRDHKMVVDHGALGFAISGNFLMFVYDTVSYKNQPRKIDSKKLFYLVHEIKSNKMFPPMNYDDYMVFLNSQQISQEYNLALRDFSRYEKK